MTSKFDVIESAKIYSNTMLSRLCQALAKASLGDSVCVVITGSFGRKEASGESDVDFFIVHDSKISDSQAELHKATVASEIDKVIPKPPAEDGAFNATVSIDSLLQNIGGSNESNLMMTRRMLLMLEGACIYNELLFKVIRRQILDRYITHKISNHQVALFFLNDVIRYYRTMCVDFEYKTVEQRKPWGIRNLKLMYSRKLLYFGGVVAVAESAQRGYEAKVVRMLELLEITPIQRIESLFGDRAFECLAFYEKFLTKIQDQGFRASLANVTIDRETHTDAFRELKDEAQHFTWALQQLLESRYVAGHPIHRALIF